VLEDNLSIDHRHEDSQIQDLVYRTGHDVIGQNDEISQFAGLQRPFDILLEC